MFLQEVRDNLASLNQSVVRLEKEPNNMELLQEIMRLSHSSKSVAASVGFTSTSDLFHALEDIFDAARTGTFAVTNEMTDLCFQALDAIEQSLKTIEQTGQETDCSSAIQALRDAFTHVQDTQNQSIPSPQGASPSPAAPSTDHQPSFSKINYIRVETEKVDRITNLAGELTLLHQQLRRAQMDGANTQPHIENLDHLVQELTYQSIEMRLVPLEQAFAQLPRLVRDMAKSQNKQVRFSMEGIESNLDKSLVDHLLAPITHMLRNAVDHGIETADVRSKAGKSAEGVIRLIVERSQGFARVTVEDDGNRIDVQHLKDIAAKRGFTSSELQDITESTILDLLCSARFSSTEEVSALSGRGVGLSAVRQSAQALGGQFTLTHSETGKRFTLSLPLNLSIIQALLITVDDRQYALPLIHVQRLLTLPQEEIRTALGEPAAVIDGATVPLIVLSELFAPHTTELASALPVTPEPQTQNSQTDKVSRNIHTHDRPIILVASQENTIGLIVDGLVGKAEIMVKPVTRVIRDIEYFAGSTILADGHVALILDVPSLIRAKEHSFISSPIR